jgi:hypothetical protein
MPARTRGGFTRSKVMAATYRKRKGYDTWHFCSNCSQWPTSNYDEKTEKPTTGEFCNECKSKRANNNCT